MAAITLKGNPINTKGFLPSPGDQAPDFTLVKSNLSEVSLSNYKDTKLVLNIFPSLDTGTCAASVRKFNKLAASLPNTKVLCISRDLPFAHARFCTAEGIENVETLSDFATGDFGKAYNLEIIDGPLKGLHSRAIIILDENHTILHTQQVAETTDEPNYDAVIEVLG